MSKGNKFQLLGVIIGIISIVFLIACIGAAEWSVYKVGANRSHMGIFRYCSTLGSSESCTAWTNDCNDDNYYRNSDARMQCQKRIATGAFITMAILLGSIGLILEILGAFANKINCTIPGGILMIIAGVFALIGFAVGTSLVKDQINGTEAGASVGLAVIGWIFAFVSGILAIKGGKDAGGTASPSI